MCFSVQVYHKGTNSDMWSLSCDQLNNVSVHVCAPLQVM